MKYADVKPAPQATSVYIPEQADTKPVVKPLPPPPTIPADLPELIPVEKKKDTSNGSVVTDDELFVVVRPKPATAKIFAPRTEDMNKGYITFSKDDPHRTMFNENPGLDELERLAPTAGDACISLEENTLDLFGDFMLEENYCGLLEAFESGSPVNSFGNDSLLLSSPDTQESDSSCEQSSSLTELSLDGAISDSDLDCRTSYVPLSGSDDLPILAPAVMWGALPDSVTLTRPSPPAPPPQETPSSPGKGSSLKRLLVSPLHTGPPPQDIITNIYADQGLMPSGAVATWDTGVKRGRGEPEDSSAKRSKRTAPQSPQQTPRCSPGPTSSVLMNLLVSGCDMNAGYVCLVRSKPRPKPGQARA